MTSGLTGISVTKTSVIMIIMLIVACNAKNSQPTESRQVEISENEKKALFSLTDLVDNGYDFDLPPAGSEKFNKIIFDDGYELTYEYETPFKTGTKDVMINTSIRLYKNEADAKRAYDKILSGSTLKAFVSHLMEQSERTDIPMEGKESKLLEYRGRQNQKVAGYVLVSRLTNRIYLTYFLSPFQNNLDVWSKIIQDKLTKARNLENM
jgi:hypothetical protein